MILALVALSLDLLVGVTGMVSLAQAAFFGIAGYSLVLFAPEFEAVNFWLALLLCLGVSAAAALLMGLLNLGFQQALPVAVITAASSNYLVNNALTFRDRRQRGTRLVRGLLKFLLVTSLPAIANIGLATSFYNLIQANTLWAQLAGIVVVYIWNYAASSRFVWNSP